MLTTKLTESIDTLAVGGGILWVNRGYFTDPKFSDGNRVFMIAHELCHEMLFHPALMEEYMLSGIDGEPFDGMRMNYAMDYCDNDMLVKMGVGEYHEEWLLSPHFTYEDNIVDVYRRLKPKNPPPQQGGGGGDQDGQSGSGQGAGSGSPDGQQGGGASPDAGQPGPASDQAGEGSDPGKVQYDILDKNGNKVGETPASQRPMDTHDFSAPSPHTKDDWKQAVAGAYQQAKSIGAGSAMMDRFVDEYISTKRDWRKELRDYITAHRGRESFDWKKPHKRKMRERRIPIPTRHSYRLGDIVKIHDVSGSVSHDEHILCKSAGLEIIGELPPKRLRILCCAEHVTDDTECTDLDDYRDWQPKGTGGTNMENAFKYLIEDGHIPDLCIVLTDGYTGFTEPPPFPVVWLSTALEVEEFPYGHAIKLEEE
jgi:hypothetical protein